MTCTTKVFQEQQQSLDLLIGKEVSWSRSSLNCCSIERKAFGFDQQLVKAVGIAAKRIEIILLHRIKPSCYFSILQQCSRMHL